MEEFFSKKETESKSRPDGKTYSCFACGLHKDCESPKMKPFGNFKKKILNIGEAPGEMEDRKGKPFQGKTGKLLESTYRSLGIDLFEDCLNMNAINCHPEENRAPENFEMESCRKLIMPIIEQYKPKVIVLLGNSAIYSLIGHRWKKDLGGISKWRGWTIPDQDFKAWICPTFHPSYVDRVDSKDVMTIWKDDLKQAVECLNKQFLIHKEPQIEIIEDLSVLDYITSNEVAIDYETTGIKPHAPEHRIISASVADTEDHVYSFMMPPSPAGKRPFLNLLANPKIGKIAHNMKFEDTWSNVRLRQSVENWVWDTMIASHIVDNRPGITSLKFQVYINFGIVDYSSDVAPYLSGTDGVSANSINKIRDLLLTQGGVKKLLTYGGYDGIYEFRLAKKQRMNILPF